MELDEAYINLRNFKSPHGTKWNAKLAPYKVLSCLDFANEEFFTTDIDCTQLAKDLSIWVIYEEKFHCHNEFINDNNLQVQKRMLELADKANVPAFLVLTSRKNSKGIICGTPELGIDWHKYIGTIAALYDAGDIKAAEEALGNGIADIYSESNVIKIISNNAAKKHNYKNKRIGNYLNNYKGGATVGKLNTLLKAEFPSL